MSYPPEFLAKIRRMHFAEHWRVGTVATQLGVHPDVVRRACGFIDRKARKPREVLLGPYKEIIAETLKEYPTLLSTRIMDMLVPRGYDGSIKTLRNYVREVRPRKTPSAALRLETLPAEQAQVDWAYVGKLTFDGSERGLWLFLIVLSYSRAMWGEFVLDLGAASLQRSMVRGLSFFGGSSRVWLFDNAKSIATARHGKAVRFHPGLVALADAYRAEPRVCTVRAPQQKGKVERLVRYVRDAFLVGRSIRSVDQGNSDLLKFITSTANVRPHPVRRDETISDAFAHEQTLLLPLPSVPPPTDQIGSSRVSRDGYVRFDSNSYSVPAELVGKRVSISASDTHVRVVDGDICHAEHRRCWAKRHTIEAKEHRQSLVQARRQAQPSRGQDRLRTAAPSIDRLFERWVLENRNIGSLTVKAMKLLDLYGDRVFAAAVDSLNQRGTHDVGALAVVCEQLRRAANRPVPVPIELGGHIPDTDVIPHTMEAYDHVDDDHDL